MTKPDLNHKQLSVSGFPFQLRVEREVMLSEQEHGWKVVTREHAWKNSERGSSGFIDLVLQHNQLSTLRLVMECKRQRGDDARSAQWLFLAPEEEAVETDIVRCLSLQAWRHTRHTKQFDGENNNLIEVPSEEWKVLRVWDDVRITPASMESQFCVMQSDESRRQPILESLCGELLDSVDGLAEDEVNVAKSPASSRRVRAFYIPVVVTNAQLRLCTFNVESVSMADGIIPHDKCKIETLPFLRFRKSLVNDFPDDYAVENIREANQARERTVFVVNSEGLKDFLVRWKMKPADGFDGYALLRRIREIQAEK